MTTLLSPPPEWAPQDKILIGWPSHPEPWGDEEIMRAARVEVAGYANALIEAGDRFAGAVTGVILVVDGKEAEASAREAVPGADIWDMPCGDTWLRDTGPISSWQAGKLQARSFGFNGWGGKYLYPGDADLSVRLAERMGAELREFDFFLEGGSVDWDGEGLILTTDECLLNPNRNVGWTRDDAEAALKDAFGVSEVIWIKRGLLNDHTDGHIDNAARFVGPGHVVCQAPNGDDDPHTERLVEIRETLERYRTKSGKSLMITDIPSPGHVVDEDGDIMPASHMNFVISNQAIIIPAYNSEIEAAKRAMAPLFPEREILSAPSYVVLSEGGSFHCISQQIPARPAEAE